MTLHEAIEYVLREGRRPMTANEIANAVNRENLYVRNDKREVTASQISARVAKYADVFKIDNQGISLHDISLRPYKDLAVRLNNLLARVSGTSNIIVNDVVASFLVVIYQQGHTTSISPHQIYSPKGLIISLFRNTEQELSFVDGLFTSAIDFISTSLQDRDADEIIRLIAHYDFPSLPKPIEDEFATFFNDTVNLFSWKNYFRGGEFSTPKLVSNLMCSLYELPRRTRVFDPFAGRASLLSELIRRHRGQIYEVFAGDLMQSSVTIGSLNLLVSGIRFFDYKRRNAFLDWQGTVEADLFVSNPPFGGKLDTYIMYQDWQRFPTTDINVNVIQLALHHINQRGKAVIIVPEGFLFSNNKANSYIRQYLIEENILAGIISLPKNSFKPYTAVSASILMIDKARAQSDDEIFFYDASDSALSGFENETGQIVTSFQSKQSVNKNSRWVPRYSIIEQNYNLVAKRYLLQILDQPLEGQHNVPLKELALAYIGTHITSDNTNKTEGTPFIQIGDLPEGEGLQVIDARSVRTFISDLELVQTQLREVQNGAVLIAKAGVKLKPTLFEGNASAVASSNIIVLQPHDNVLPEYLVAQLQSDYVVKQIDAIRRYNTIANFSLRELLNINVAYLPYEEQQQFVARYYSRKISKLESTDSKEQENELYNIISRIKHEVKQPVSSIGIDVSILLAYLQQKAQSNETVSLEDYTVEPLPGQSEEDLEATKVKYLFSRMKSSVDDAQETLQKAEEILNIGKGTSKFEVVELRGFLETLVSSSYQNANCTIQVKGREVSVLADRYQLKVLFKNLFENAIKHGFRDERSRNENVIKIELSRDQHKSFAEVTVMNNGRPFPRGFNKGLFETMGKTTDRNNGSGFGGYHIKKVIENHRGELHISDSEDVQFSDFKVRFKIYLPLNL